MRECIQRLSELCDDFQNIELNRFEPAMTQEMVIAEIQADNARIRSLRDKSDSLLNENLFPLLENYRDITDEEADFLFDCAQRRSAFTLSADPALALKIYQALLSRERMRQNRDGILKYVYWCAITDFFLRDSTDYSVSLFQEGAAYMAEYDTIEDIETRKYVHRCLGNCTMSLHELRRHEEAHQYEEKCFSFWNNLIFQKKDAELPWKSYFMSVLIHKHDVISYVVHNTELVPTRDDIMACLEISVMINRLLHRTEAIGTSMGDTRFDLILWEAQAMAGLINVDQMLEHVRECFTLHEKGDFGHDALYVNLLMPSHAIRIAKRMLPEGNAHREDIIREMSDHVHNFLLSLPVSADDNSIAWYLRMYVEDTNIVEGKGNQLEFILNLTTFRHLPTYTHSQIVAEIALLLTQAVAKVDPHYFDSVPCSVDSEEAEARQTWLHKFVQDVGLCHDIGKFKFVTSPAVFMRPLTEAEIVLIKEHPQAGYNLLKQAKDMADFAGYAAVILGHHRYYDDSAGYPETFNTKESPYKPIIDIVSVADALEAATDDIGRCYAPFKSLGTIIDEIQAESGTRYSPAIVRLLSQPDITAQLGLILTEHRKSAYYKAYLSLYGRGE